MRLPSSLRQPWLRWAVGTALVLIGAILLTGFLDDTWNTDVAGWFIILGYLGTPLLAAYFAFARHNGQRAVGVIVGYVVFVLWLSGQIIVD